MSTLGTLASASWTIGGQCAAPGFVLQAPCLDCGQLNVGQTGSEPCEKCGLPQVWDIRNSEDVEDWTVLHNTALSLQIPDRWVLEEGVVLTTLEGLEVHDGTIVVDSDGLIVAAIAPRPAFSVENQSDLEWVMERYFNADADIVALEERRALLLANMESMIQARWRERKTLDHRFGPLVKQYLESHGGHQVKTPFGVAKITESKVTKVEPLSETGAGKWCVLTGNTDWVEMKPEFKPGQVPESVRPFLPRQLFKLTSPSRKFKATTGYVLPEQRKGERSSLDLKTLLPELTTFSLSGETLEERCRRLDVGKDVVMDAKRVNSTAPHGLMVVPTGATPDGGWMCIVRDYVGPAENSRIEFGDTPEQALKRWLATYPAELPV